MGFIMTLQRGPVRAVTLSALAFATTLTWMPDVSFARRGFGFGVAAGIMGGMMMRGYPGGGGRHRYRGGGGGSGDSPSNTPASNENAALQMEALILTTANQKSEEWRNVDEQIKNFIKFLELKHQDLRKSRENVRASSGSNINQITEGEIRVALEKAYQEAHLTDFDALSGELWTHDRLQVQVLWIGRDKIAPYFNGVGAKGPDVNNLQDALKQSSELVYLRALEMSEIIGVSRSFDHFIRTIYENSDQAPANLWTVGADVQYERMVTAVINDVDRDFFVADREAIDNQRAAKLAVRLSHQFDFRFRARRALYDCLAAGYTSLISKAPLPPQNAAGAQGSRGAKMDIFSRFGLDSLASKPSAPEVINVVESGDTSDEVWKRARQWTAGRCQNITRPIAKTAADSGLKPIAARIDLAVAAGMAADRSEGQYLQIRTGDPR
jgi:hypothetical protein